MSLYDVPTQEKIQLLESWRDRVQLDVDEYQSLVNEQLEKKRVLEEKLAKKMRPVYKKMAVFQKYVDSFTNKRNQIDKEIQKIKDEQEKNVNK